MQPRQVHRQRRGGVVGQLFLGLAAAGAQFDQCADGVGIEGIELERLTARDGVEYVLHDLVVELSAAELLRMNAGSDDACVGPGPHQRDVESRRAEVVDDRETVGLGSTGDFEPAHRGDRLGNERDVGQACAIERVAEHLDGVGGPACGVGDHHGGGGVDTGGDVGDEGTSGGGVQVFGAVTAAVVVDQFDGVTDAIGESTDEMARRAVPQVGETGGRTGTKIEGRTLDHRGHRVGIQGGNSRHSSDPYAEPCVHLPPPSCRTALVPTAVTRTVGSVPRFVTSHSRLERATR